MASKALRIALTVLTCASLILPPTVAEAGASTGTWRNGMVAGPYGVGWYGSRGFYGSGWHHPHYGGWGYGGYHPWHHGYYGGYAPAYYGGYGYYPGYYYGEDHSDSGAALAAGLIGGIALGAIMAGAASGSRRCSVVSRRVMTPSGHIGIRHVRIC